MEFKEADAVKAMQAAVATKYNEDELLNVLDIIWDWYEENGQLDIDADDADDELDMEALVKYVAKMLRADKDGEISPDDAEALVKAELEYEDSLDD